MSEEKKVVRIRLQPGDTPARVLSVLQQLKGKKVYCELSPKFVLITQQSFLKQLKNLWDGEIEDLYFFTQKTFFRELLEKKDFTVLSDWPEDLAEVETKSVRDFLDRVLATKNATKKLIAETPVEINPSKTETEKIKQKAQFTKRKIENLAREKSFRGVVFFLFLGLILGLGALFFFITPRAEIIVKPRIDTIETTQNVIIALAGAEVPASESQLPQVPAILVETEIEGIEVFASTKKEYEMTNARGKVVLYNEDREAKALVPSRLQTSDGMIFRTQRSLTIPGATDEGPGSLEVEIVADEYDTLDRPVGDRGNVEFGTEFFFPGLREPLQELYYARADRGPLVGGSTLTRYFVSEEDPELSRAVLEESFRVRGVQALRDEIDQRNAREKSNYILLDRANIIQTKMVEYNFPEEAIGQEQQTFRVEALYRIGGVVFDQAVVVDHLQAKLRKNQDERKKIIEIDESTVDYRLLHTESLSDAGWAKASVSLVGVETIDFDADNIFAKKWREEIKREVSGRDLSQARGILVNHPEVDEVLSLNLSPFWNKVIPTILDQIDLKIKY